MNNIRVELYIKNGIGGYYDEYGPETNLGTIYLPILPEKGDKLKISPERPTNWPTMTEDEKQEFLNLKKLTVLSRTFCHNEIDGTTYVMLSVVPSSVAGYIY